MNIAIIVGRLTKDPEIRYTQSGKAVATFTLAVDRRFKQDGQPSADFLPCVAWGKTAEVAGKYLAKGHRCGVEGRIQTRSYESNGQKRYVTEVIVDQLEFLESKKKESGNSYDAGQFGEPVPDEEIPFN